MAEIVRAIYERGHLRPLHPLSLTDGQEIDLAILSPREHARALLSDLLVPVYGAPLLEVDEAVVAAEIDAAVHGTPSISTAILEERHEGP